MAAIMPRAAVLSEPVKNMEYQKLAVTAVNIEDYITSNDGSSQPDIKDDSEISISADNLPKCETLITTKLNEHGDQIIIVSSNDDHHQLDSIPGAALVDQIEHAESMEPPTKRIRIQQQNGEAVIFAVDSDLAEEFGKKDYFVEEENESEVSQAWFTTKDDKSAFHNKGHSWKQGQWSREETELLSANISNYCKDHAIEDPTEIIFEMSKDDRKDFYRTIARGLERPLFSVYRRVIRMYDRSNHMGKYSPEEIAKLKQLRLKYGTDWATIGAALGRSASSVKDRCRLMKDTCNTGKWLPDEEQKLSAAVYEQVGCKPGDSVTSGLSWAAVAEKVQSRSEKQCRTKWLNYLNWKQKGGTEWTREDDNNLVKRISESGATEESQINWTELAKGWSSARSPQWLRGKWWSIKRHVENYQILPFTDVVNVLNTLYNQNVRLKSPFTPSQKVETTDLNMLKLSFVPDMQNMQVPIVVSSSGGVVDTSSLMNGVTLQSVGEELALGSADNPIQALEVIPNISSAGILGQNAFLITQPQLASSLSLVGGQIPSDHIIVHTLPIMHQPGFTEEDMANKQFIISTMPGQECFVNMQLQDDIVPADEELGSLAENSEDPVGDSNIDVTETIANMETVHVKSENIAQTEAFDNQVLNIPVVEPDLEAVTGGAATVDMVLAATSSPQFVQAPGTFIHMSSLSDPMLTSNDVDLMGSSSDVEGEKVVVVEDPDVDRDVDSPTA